MSHSILLIASETAARPVTDGLRSSMDVAVEFAPNRRAGLALLRRREYTLILLDESIAAENADAANTLYQNAGSAPLLEVNFAITSVPRLVRQVRASILRREQDLMHVRAAVAVRFQQELNATLSALLLESQLALKAATPEQMPKLMQVVSLALELRDRLRS